MMAIIVWILKMAGLVILSLIGILLFLLLLILFVPIRYRVKGKYQEVLEGEVRVSWLFPVLTFCLTYQDEVTKSFRLFGISLGRKKRKAKKDSQADQEIECEPSDQMPEEAAEMPPKQSGSEVREVAEKERTEQTEVREVAEKEQTEQTEVREAAEKEQTEQTEVREVADKEQTEQTEAEKSKKKKWFRLRRSRKKTTNLRQRLKRTRQRISDRFLGVKETGGRIWAFLHDEENQKTFRLVQKETRHLIRHLLPTRLKGTVRFGMEDPADTGQILAWISPFYGVYAKHFSLTPVFEEAVLKGTVDARGRVRIGTVLWILIGILRDKNFRTLIKKARKD